MKLLRPIQTVFRAATSSVRQWFLDSSYNSLQSVGVVQRTLAGVFASPTTSMKISAYYAAIRNISEDIGKLPIRVSDVTRDGVKTEPENATIVRLLTRRPNGDMTAMTFKETLTAHALGWGNGYAQIRRDMLGRPVELIPIHPQRVIVECLPGTDQIVYQVMLGEKLNGGLTERVTLMPQDVFHLKGPGGDGYVGYSIVKFASESLGAAIAAQQFGSAFFGNNSHLGGYLEHPNTLSEEAQNRLVSNLEKNHRGSEKAFRISVLEEGMKWHNTTIPPREAQFIEVREFQVTEIARWFRIPPHKIGDLTRSTFSNVVEQNIDYINDTLMPWIVRWEEEIAVKLIQTPRRIAKFQVQALLRGDSKSRSEYYRTMFQMGTITPNEIRLLEDMNPAAEEGADKLYMQSAMATIDQINMGILPDEGGSQIPRDDSSDIEEPGTLEQPAATVVAFDPRPLVEAAVDRVNAKERKVISRGKATPEFYATQEQYLVETVRPVFDAMGIGVEMFSAVEYYQTRAADPAAEIHDAGLVSLVLDCLKTGVS